MLGCADPLPKPPRRVLVAGPSGVGKTTLAVEIARRLGVPHLEIDGLYHGPNWIPRPTFAADVDKFTTQPGWTTEWQYRQVRALLVDRADTLVWLDHPRATVLYRVISRTVRRRILRVPLWNGNHEGPLWTFFTDRDHIVRWSWRVYSWYTTAVPALVTRQTEVGLTIIRLRGQRQVDAWLSGPLSAVVVDQARSTREVEKRSPP